MYHTATNSVLVSDIAYAQTLELKVEHELTRLQGRKQL